MKIAQIDELTDCDREEFDVFEFVEVLQYDPEDNTYQCRLENEPKYWIDSKDVNVIRSEE